MGPHPPSWYRSIIGFLPKGSQKRGRRPARRGKVLVLEALEHRQLLSVSPALDADTAIPLTDAADPEATGQMAYAVADTAPLTTMAMTSATADPEAQAGLTLVQSSISISGEFVKTEWSKADGNTAIKVDAAINRPQLKIRKAGGTFSAPVTLTHYVRDGNELWWVIPETHRPTSAADTIVVSFPEGTVALATDPLQSNLAQADLVIENQFGQEPFPLPESPRAPTGANVGWMNYWQNYFFTTDLAQTAGPWNNAADFNERGIPVSGVKANSKVYYPLWAGWSESPAEDVYVLWKDDGTGKSDVTMPWTEAPGGKQTVTWNGQAYFMRHFVYSSSIGAEIRLKTDENKLTHVTGFHVTVGSMLDDFLAGKLLASSFKEQMALASYLRYMDATYTNNSNIVKAEHFNPADFSSQDRRLTYSAQVATIEPYAGPETYFDDAGNTLFKITLTSPSPFYTGQRFTLTSTTAKWWRQRSPATIKQITSGATTFTTTNLSAFTTGSTVQFTTTGVMPGGMAQKKTYYLRVQTATEFTLHSSRADAENGTGALCVTSPGNGALQMHSEHDLNNRPVDVYREAAGFDDRQILGFAQGEGYVETGAGGDATNTVKPGMSPEFIASVQNEMYEYTGGRSRIAWINRPHASDDAAFQNFLERLHANLNPNIEIWVEYSNEVWNYAAAFNGQTGYAARQATKLGIDMDGFYAKKTYDNYKLLESVVGGSRSYKVVAAGQQANSWHLQKRMDALQKELERDADPRKPSWEELPVVMSVALYVEYVDTNPTTAQSNRDGLAQVTAAGAVEVAELKMRGLSAYPAIKAQFGKELWAYEGGVHFIVSGNSAPDYAQVQRRVFAAQLHPRAANLLWENWRRATEEYGFDGVNGYLRQGNWSVDRGASWGDFYSYDQEAGRGDGTDGKFNNLAALDNYMANGESDPSWKEFVSVRGYAQDMWAGMMQSPQADEIPKALTSVASTFSTTLDPAIFGGKSKFAVSTWIKWDQDQTTSYQPLFGSHDAAWQTDFFSIRRYGSSQYHLKLALDDNGTRKRVDLVSSNVPDDEWVHVYAYYDSTLPEGTDNLFLYLNGVLSAQTRITAASGSSRGMKLWTPSAEVPIRLTPKGATLWSFAEAAVWAGDSIPTVEQMQSYAAGERAMGSLPASTLLWSMQSEGTQRIPEDNDYLVEDRLGKNLAYLSGSASFQTDSPVSPLQEEATSGTLHTSTSEFSTTLEPAIFGGKSKFAVSTWIKWDQDQTAAYQPLFGSHDATWQTDFFSIRRYGSSQYHLKLALNDNGTRKRVDLVSSNVPDDEWVHIYACYDSTLPEGTDNLLLYLNGVLSAKSRITAASGSSRGMKLWTPSTEVPLRLTPNGAALWSFGETALWAGNSVPTVEQAYSYAADAVKMQSLPKPSLLWRMQSECAQRIPEDIDCLIEDNQGRHLVYSKGWGALDPQSPTSEAMKTGTFITSGSMLSTPLAPDLFGGKSKLAVSTWIRWDQDQGTSYHPLLGNYDPETWRTDFFQIRRYGSSKYHVKMAVNDGGAKKEIDLITSQVPDNEWVHLYIYYDSTLPDGSDNFYIHLNGGLSAQTRVTGASGDSHGLTLWRPAEQASFTLTPQTAPRWSFGETAVWAGDKIPSVAQAQSYATNSLTMTSLPTPSLLWRMQSDAAQRIPEDIDYLMEDYQGRHLVYLSGSGTLSCETTSVTGLNATFAEIQGTAAVSSDSTSSDTSLSASTGVLKTTGVLAAAEQDRTAPALQYPFNTASSKLLAIDAALEDASDGPARVSLGGLQQVLWLASVEKVGARTSSAEPITGEIIGVDQSFLLWN